ncbi:MAG: S-layer protein [Clostridia bacterium]|nr:S-layer protein [Clostridia bacterium]
MLMKLAVLGLLVISIGTGGNVYAAEDNTAPLLMPRGGSLPLINEDCVDTESFIADFITGAIFDLDDGALQGIAIIGWTGNGMWWYSVDDGITWTLIQSVSEGSALLLRDIDLIRYMPDGRRGETATITYRAWDQTTGSAGGTADVFINGGSEAFSIEKNTVSILVTDVNDAPSITVPSVISVEANTPSRLGGITFADVDAGSGSVMVTLAAPTGTLEAMSSGGVGSVGSGTSLMTLAGSISDINAFISGGNLLFNSRSNMPESISLSININDNGNTGEGGAKGNNVIIMITSVMSNQAPILTPISPVLNVLSADDRDNAGQIVASFIGTSITDVGPLALKGIAIEAADSGNGGWQYSIDNGLTWQFFGAVSPGSALLLRDIDRVRFVPGGQNGTTAFITYRAWDRTTGFQGEAADVSINGGNSSYSSAVDTASITVTKVDVVPLLPTAITGLATNITAGQAVFNAEVNPHDQVTTVVFEYGLDTSYGNTAIAEQSPITGGNTLVVHKEITGLTPNTTYHYRVKAVSIAGVSEGKDQTFTTSYTAPGAPRDVRASAGNGQAAVSFLPPLSNGGSPITKYVVTSSPGNISASGINTSITVTGLTNGTSYTFTVQAVNAAGHSASSVPSNTVKPSAPSDDGGGGGGNILPQSEGQKDSPVLQVQKTIQKLSSIEKQDMLENIQEYLPYTILDAKGLKLEQLKTLTKGRFTKEELEIILNNKDLQKELGIDLARLSMAEDLHPIRDVQFNDVSPSHWASKMIEQAAGMGIAAGMPDGSFAPSDSLKAADTFTFLDRLLLLNDMAMGTLPRSTVEKYIADKEHWAFNHMASIGSKLTEKTLRTVSELGDEPISRELLAQVLYEITKERLKPIREAQAFTDTINSPYKEAISYCVSLGLLNGTGERTMSPQKALSRAELMTVLIRLNDLLRGLRLA